jgi:uncharacterized membrane protein
VCGALVWGRRDRANEEERWDVGDSDPTDQVKDAVKSQAAGEDDNKLIAPLKKAAVAAAVAALTPVVKNAVTNTAESAVKKAPELLANAGGAKGVVDLAKDKLTGGDDGGGAGQLVKGVMGAVTGGAGDGDGGGSGDAPEGTGSGRRMPVQQAVDVAAPVDIVYNQFTQFEDYPKFMHRVESVSQEDEAHVTFKSKQWAVNRQWRAEIVDQRPDERIAWKSESGVNLSGVATFHELAPRLTRIEVNVDFDPEGFFEKIGRGMRFAKRAIRADLHRFKAYVEMQEEAEGEWRGYIAEGEPVEEEDYYGEEPDEAGEYEEGEPVDEEESEEEPVAEEDLDEEESEEEPVAEEDLDEEELDEEEGADEEELEDAPAEDEDVEEEPDEPARTSAKRRSTPSSSRSMRSKSSSRDGRSRSSRGSQPRSSSRGRARAASRDGAQASSSGRSRRSSGGRSRSASGDGAKASRGGGSRPARSGPRGGRSSKYENRSRQDLQERAKEIGIEGRSKMDKDELVDALRKASNQPSSKSRSSRGSRTRGGRGRTASGSRSKS